MSQYTLIVVSYDGKAHVTNTDGYYAESMVDEFFNKAKSDSRCISAIVMDDVMPGVPRHIYVKSRFLKYLNKVAEEGEIKCTS